MLFTNNLANRGGQMNVVGVDRQAIKGYKGVAEQDTKRKEIVSTKMCVYVEHVVACKGKRVVGL